MLKIKDNVDLNVLKDYGFYLEGNRYKYDIGKGKCIGICKIDRKIYPNISNKMNKIFMNKNVFFNLGHMVTILSVAGLVEKVEE